MSQSRDPSHYYGDAEKLTYDQAEKYVGMYLNQETPREITRVKHVLQQFGFPYTDHNHIRILEVLKDRCEPYNEGKSGPKRFKIPEEYR